MKVTNVLASAFFAVFALNSAFADTQKPQPCDASWNACAIGRSDVTTPGKFVIDLLYVSSDGITQRKPLLGGGVDGEITDIKPVELQAFVAQGSTDVVLQNYPAPGTPAISYVVGKILTPIGTDNIRYYTSEIQLNPGVQFQETSQVSKKKYCDTGGVFGSVIYNQQFTTTDVVVTGVNADPVKLEIERMLILSSYPAIFGCH